MLDDCLGRVRPTGHLMSTCPHADGPGALQAIITTHCLVSKGLLESSGGLHPAPHRQ